MQRIALPDDRIVIQGRHDPKQSQCFLWWSGSGIRMRLACTCLEAEITSTASTHAIWLGVLLDGAPVARLPLQKGTHRYPVLAGMDAGFSHEITLIRDTQPGYDEEGPAVLEALYTDGGLQNMEERPLMLEFLGDSLTVGEGCVGPRSGEEWRMVFISHMPAFPTLTAEAMGAEKRVIALGGWGAARSWDGDENSRIGRIYDQLCAVIPGGDVPAAFAERPADAVIINLGTNDASGIAKLPEAEKPAARRQLTDRAEKLLRQVRARYPEAAILWAYGLCGSAAEAEIRPAVERLRREGDTRVDYLPLTDCNGDVGSRMHPSRAAHRRAALEIQQALKEKWGIGS